MATDEKWQNFPDNCGVFLCKHKKLNVMLKL